MKSNKLKSNKLKDNKLRCPECEGEIYYLINVSSGTMGYYFRLDKVSGEIEYENQVNGYVDDGKTNEWWCPLCNVALFNNEEEAKKFLIKGLPEKTKLKLVEKEI